MKLLKNLKVIVTVAAVALGIGLFPSVIHGETDLKITVPTERAIYQRNNENLGQVNISVDYSADAQTVKNLLMKAAQDNELVLDTPECEAVLINYGDSALDFQLRAWCKSEDYWQTKFALLEQIKELLDLHSIGIPYPQMDVHIDNKK